MSKRCNGKTECLYDKSDESNCSIFSHDDTYNAKYHPESKTSHDNRIPINVSIHIENIFDIKELSMEYR